MKIAISMITLNEKQYIKQSIGSCGFADYVCLVDGGSKDRTTQMAASAARKIDVELIKKERKWDDHFSNQRQAAIDIIPDDVDWWMRIDADEEFPLLFQENIRSLLESLPEDCLAARIRQVNLIDTGIYSASRGGWETWPRIFRNVRHEGKSLWNWQGQVHEYCRLMTLQGLTDPSPANLNLSVVHYGWLLKERRQEREDLYLNMPGSGFEKGSLTNREHVARILPYLALE